LDESSTIHTNLPPRPILRLANPMHLRTGFDMEVRQYLYLLSARPPSSRLHHGQFPRPPDKGCEEIKLKNHYRLPHE